MTDETKTPGRDALEDLLKVIARPSPNNTISLRAALVLALLDNVQAGHPLSDGTVDDIRKIINAEPAG